ncbi:hypothetical protein D3C73_928230 [compost metagenome]
MQRQHHADEHPGDHNDHQGHHAHRMQLLDQKAETTANAAAPQQGVEQEDGRTTERGQHVDAGVAEAAYAFQQ